jgi:replicative DNA helicase
MAAIELRIITKLLQTGSLQDAVKVGLNEEQFKDPEARQIWRYLHKHWYARDTTQTLPSIEAVQNMFPAFRTTASSLDPNSDAQLPALIRELKMASLGSDSRALANFFSELVNEPTDDPKEALSIMKGHLDEILCRYSDHQIHGLREVVDCSMEHYDAAVAGTVFGIPWPWDCLTNDSLGKRPGDFVVFYARMKQMKTWVMLYCAVYDYIVNNCKVLIWSREMSLPKMTLRIASLVAKVDYQLFKKGKLPEAVKARAWEVLHQLRDEVSCAPGVEKTEGKAHRGLILLCGHSAPRELEVVQSIIQQEKPDVAYLDSFYHLETARSKGVKQRWDRVAILAEDVKSMAEDEQIPVIAVHQANRSGEKKSGGSGMADMADSDVIAREADLVMRIMKRRARELHEEDYEVAIEVAKREAKERRLLAPKLGRPRLKLPPKVQAEVDKREEAVLKAAEDDGIDEEDKRFGAELALVLSGNREGVLHAFTVKAIPGYNFEFISDNYSESQIQEWIDEDDLGKGKGEAGSGKKPGIQKPSVTPKAFANLGGEFKR